MFGLISLFRQRGSSTNFPRTNFFLFQTLFSNSQGVDLQELEVAGWIVGICLLLCALFLDFLSIWYFPIVLKRSWHLGSVLLKSFLLHYSIWNDLLTGIIHKIIFNHKNNSSFSFFEEIKLFLSETAAAIGLHVKFWTIVKRLNACSLDRRNVSN